MQLSGRVGFPARDLVSSWGPVCTHPASWSTRAPRPGWCARVAAPGRMLPGRGCPGCHRSPPPASRRTLRQSEPALRPAGAPPPASSHSDSGQKHREERRGQADSPLTDRARTTAVTSERLQLRNPKLEKLKKKRKSQVVYSLFLRHLISHTESKFFFFLLHLIFFKKKFFHYSLFFLNKLYLEGLYKFYYIATNMKWYFCF